MRRLPFIAAALFAFTLAARADTAYSYTGGNYHFVENESDPSKPYTTSENVTGYIYFHYAPDPDPQAPDDIVVTNFSFNDGVNTFVPSNATASLYLEPRDPGEFPFFSIDVFGSSGSIYVLYSATHSQTVVEQSNGNYATVAGVGMLAPIPEPSSFVLLGTGVLGVAAALRKRFV